MIITQRLTLMPVTQDHLSIYQEILGSDELTKYLPKGGAYTDTEIRNHLCNRIEHWGKNGFGSYAIFANDNIEIPIGYVGIELCPNPDFSDIRYAISSNAQGKGYITEASSAVMAETFKLGRHRKIYGVSLIDNKPSISVLCKLGMIPEHHTFPYGKDDHLLVFSIANKIIES